MAGFGDPQLDALIDEEDWPGSPDTRWPQRVRAAESSGAAGGGGAAPACRHRGQRRRGVQQSRICRNPPAFVPGGIQDTGSITATFGFDLDLWGKNRAALAAATSKPKRRASICAGAADADDRDTTAYADLAEAVYRSRRRAGRDPQSIRGAAPICRQAHRRRARQSGDAAAGQRRLGARRCRGDRGGDRAHPQPPCCPARRRTRSRPDHRASGARQRRRSRCRRRRDRSGRPPARHRRSPGCGPKRRRSASMWRVPPFIRTSTCRRSSGLQSLGLSNLFKTGSNMAMAAPRSATDSRAGSCRVSIAGRRPMPSGAVANYDRTLVAALRDVADIVASRDAASAPACRPARRAEGRGRRRQPGCATVPAFPASLRSSPPDSRVALAPLRSPTSKRAGFRSTLP